MKQVNPTFDPAHHLFTLINHTTQMHSVKSLMGRVFYQFIEKGCYVGRDFDQLQQLHIHHHISLGTLVYCTTLSKTN